MKQKNQKVYTIICYSKTDRKIVYQDELLRSHMLKTDFINLKIYLIENAWMIGKSVYAFIIDKPLDLAMRIFQSYFSLREWDQLVIMSVYYQAGYFISDVHIFDGVDPTETFYI